MKINSIFLCLLVFVLLSLVVGGCGSPCTDLANKVCNCQPTRARREHCKTAIAAADKNISLSSEEDNRCQDVLDSGRCTCEALQGMDYAACGLSEDAISALQ
jgi:hypothetical protein